MRPPGSIPTEWKRLIARAEASGFSIGYTGGGHLKWVAPSGDIMFTATSPSDRRAIYKARSRLRRIGLKEEG